MPGEPTPLLVVDGEVQHPLRLTFDDLRGIDAAQQIDDVSRIDPARRGGAVWLAPLLERAQVRPDAEYITFHASADDFHASVPLAAVRERGMLIYRWEDGPLPVEAGGPVRFYIRDYASCQAAEIDECANVKFVDRIELSRGRGRDNRPQDEDEHAELHQRQE